jgi:hypothetical protein
MLTMASPASNPTSAAIDLVTTLVIFAGLISDMIVFNSFILN